MDSTMSLLATTAVVLLVLLGVGTLFTGEIDAFQNTNDPSMTKADCQLRAAQGHRIPRECRQYNIDLPADAGERSSLTMIDSSCPDVVGGFDPNQYGDGVLERWLPYEMLPDETREKLKDPSKSDWFWLRCEENTASMQYGVRTCSTSKYPAISQMKLDGTRWGLNRKGYCPSPGLNGYYSYDREKYVFTLVSGKQKETGSAPTDLYDKIKRYDQSPDGFYASTYSLKISNSSTTVFSGFTRTSGTTYWPWQDSGQNTDVWRERTFSTDRLPKGTITVRANSTLDALKDYCATFKVTKNSLQKIDGCKQGSRIGERFTAHRQVDGDYVLGMPKNMNYDSDEPWTLSTLEGKELFSYRISESWSVADNSNGEDVRGVAKAPERHVLGEDGIPVEDLPKKVVVHYSPSSFDTFCAGFFTITEEKGIVRTPGRNQFCFRSTKRYLMNTSEGKKWQNWGGPGIPEEGTIGFSTPDSKLPVKVKVLNVQGELVKEIGTDQLGTTTTKSGEHLYTIDASELLQGLEKGGKYIFRLHDRRFGQLLVYLADGPSAYTY